MSVVEIDPQVDQLSLMAVTTDDKLLCKGTAPGVRVTLAELLQQAGMFFECFICGVGFVVLWGGLKPTTRCVDSVPSWEGHWCRPESTIIYDWHAATYCAMCLVAN